MNTITSIIDYTSANAEAIIIIQQALCSALSAIFQLVGLTTASKVFGTIAALDLGRIIRRVKETKDAAKKAGLVAVVALLVGCSSNRVEPEVYSADRLISVLSGAVDLVDAVSAKAIASLPADCSEETAQLARDVTARVGETRAAVAALEDGRAEVCVAATQISKLATLAAALDEQASQGAALAETVRKLAGCQ